jgi:hypothetical protein
MDGQIDTSIVVDLEPREIRILRERVNESRDEMNAALTFDQYVVASMVLTSWSCQLRNALSEYRDHPEIFDEPDYDLRRL